MSCNTGECLLDHPSLLSCATTTLPPGAHEYGVNSIWHSTFRATLTEQGRRPVGSEQARSDIRIIDAQLLGDKDSTDVEPRAAEKPSSETSPS
jgi:hypothetical protein